MTIYSVASFNLESSVSFQLQYQECPLKHNKFETTWQSRRLTILDSNLDHRDGFSPVFTGPTAYLYENHRQACCLVLDSTLSFTPNFHFSLFSFSSYSSAAMFLLPIASLPPTYHCYSSMSSFCTSLFLSANPTYTKYTMSWYHTNLIAKQILSFMVVNFH